MDEREQQAPRYPLPEVIQPDPMLQPQRNLLGTAMVYVGAAVIVVLVLYGLTRPEATQQEAANAPSAATQTEPAGPPAQPSTTGQGSGQGQGPSQGQSNDQAKPEKSGGQPARSDSSNDTGSKNQPRQQAQ
jgi:hypothetical protein